jgi:CheY-like chemotaxis protein/DNA-binding CsgD family transcriptional regulator
MKKILIVDDEPDSIYVFKVLLSQHNYEVLSITDPLLAIETIYQTNPDLIILDWMMPQKEGIEVLKEVKAIPELFEIPVIISSGLRVHSHNLKDALLAGAIDLIKKPIDELELEARVKSALHMVDCLKERRYLQEMIHLTALKKKEKETIVSAVNILQKRKQLDNLKTDIFEQITTLSEEHREKINDILNKHEEMASGFNWELFKRRFTDLNTEFYQNLTLKHPDLSSTEQHLCAYFKLGLTPKEISILNVSTLESVRKAVYRIRKKMDVDEKTNLNIFMQAY